MSTGDSRNYNLRVRLTDRRDRQSRTYEPVRDYIHGIVFSIGGSIFADRAGNYIHVHEWASNASQEQAYLPPHIGVWEGAGVWMMRAPKYPYELEIIRVHVSPYPRAIIDHSGTSIGRAQIANHGVNHWYPTEATVGPDPVLVWHSALQIFKSVANKTDLTVRVGPLFYGSGGSRAYFPSGPFLDLLDLTAFLPSSGMAARVLVYLNTVTGLLAGVSSAEVTPPASPAYPDTPFPGIASAYFYLEDTYTTLDMTSDYVDARQWLSGGSGSVPAATIAGQQLFADSGLIWVTGKILTSGGNVLVSGGDVVWSPT